MSEPWTNLSFQAGQVFTPGAPISERALFSGRLNQIRKVLDTISQTGYHAVLYGERGVGKTFFVKCTFKFYARCKRRHLFPKSQL